MMEEEGFGEYSPERAWLKILSDTLEKIFYEYHKWQNLQVYSARDFSIKDFSSKFLQETADSVTFTEEILTGKLHFSSSVTPVQGNWHYW